MQQQLMYMCLFENIPKKILDYAFSICDELENLLKLEVA